MAGAEWNPPVAPPRPVKVRKALLLTAETRPAELAAIRQENPQRHIISIPPEMAFGTGDHATTSTCLRLLVDVARERRGTHWTVADLGTGTGVLAIAARKLGAGETFACDFDPFAVAAATRNAAPQRHTRDSHERTGRPAMEAAQEGLRCRHGQPVFHRADRGLAGDRQSARTRRRPDRFRHPRQPGMGGFHRRRR